MSGDTRQSRDPERYDWLAEEFLWTSDPVARDAVFRTGVIVWAFANIDFAMSKLAVRASHHPAYVGLRRRYPKEILEKVRFWREVLNAPGPLKPFEKLGLRFLARVEEVAEFRHTVAHSRLHFVADHVIHFERVRHQKGSTGAIHHYVTMTPDQLRSNAGLVAHTARLGARLVSWIERHDVFPHEGNFGLPPS